ncbi:MAG: dephospho-CoA kinase [Rhizobiaceae bacterium]|nr:dephospho-CoA kinase [Rhizobiaceae bacterium]MCV0404669.1 dephospho-CoA kinase [Rhizobiaceae bacterium]
MIVLGLTGSIGMGKSTTARMFAEAGVPVHDADAAVHRIQNGPALEAIAAAFPGVVVGGRVDRDRLGKAVFGRPEALRRLEAILHPLVRADSDAFLARHREGGTPVVLLDIPLLFETGGRDRVDKVVVVSAPADVQRERVMARPGMTAERFEAILSRQTPDAEKRARADFVIDTSRGLREARRQVRAILHELENAG